MRRALTTILNNHAPVATRFVVLFIFLLVDPSRMILGYPNPNYVQTRPKASTIILLCHISR